MEPLTETTTTTPPDFFDVLEEEWRTTFLNFRVAMTLDSPGDLFSS